MRTRIFAVTRQVYMHVSYFIRVFSLSGSLPSRADRGHNIYIKCIHKLNICVRRAVQSSQCIGIKYTSWSEYCYMHYRVAAIQLYTYHKRAIFIVYVHFYIIIYIYGVCVCVLYYRHIHFPSARCDLLCNIIDIIIIFYTREL